MRMDLRTYLVTSGSSQETFGRLLGVTQGAVGHWLAGRVPIPAERCVQIERETHGAVTRQDLRPDLFGRSADVDADAQEKERDAA